MRQRIITGIILILLLIPIFISKLVYHVNDYFYILGFILTIVAMAEMISMKETEKDLPFGVHIISYLSVIYLAFFQVIPDIFNFSMNYSLNIIPYLLILFMIYMVLDEKFKIKDASFVLLAILYIGFAFGSLVHYFSISDGIYVILYIILIAILTDTFAYFVGTFIGKHKLSPKISPKKTIEGSVGGTIVATILVPIFVIFTDKVQFLTEMSIIILFGFTLLLSILSQFGDLAASVMKRQYKIKDYGSLFPGHGGVLDRLDSILFTALCYFYLSDLFINLF